MRRSALPRQPERLFDRPWRPGHPFGPAPSRLRRWGMLVLFLVLCTLIGGYIYLTDTGRVRAMAEGYLSSLTGGTVRVGSASLSIFEGLRLENVRVLVDDLPDDQTAPDSVLFSAEMILIKYDPRVLIAGHLQANQIIAIDPHVYLTENVDTGIWNYQRMIRPPEPATAPSEPAPPMALPEVLLRSAQVDYSEIRGGTYRSLGSIAIEGRLSPSDDGDRYHFEMQSRGFDSEAVGPVVSGIYSRQTGQTVARLDHFEFGRDVRSMLPAEVRKWWEDHGLSGRLNIPLLTFMPADRDDPSSKARFRVEMELDGVRLSALPHEWLGHDELEVRDAARRSWRTYGRLLLGGLNAPQIPRLMPVLTEALSLDPVQLRYVSGRFVFTEDGIAIEHVSGRVENNLITLNGRIDGYSPAAPADIRIASSPIEHLFIPSAPKYIESMPHQVRQIYALFKPHGICDVSLRLHRATPGGRPQVSGELRIIDGNFVFEKFAYPIRKATGSIVFGRDESTGQDRLEVKDITGYGMEGGPNADATIMISGVVAPLTGNMGVDIKVASGPLVSEPALIGAMPPQVQQALRLFSVGDDPEAFPQFAGRFTCDVHRPEGHRTKWSINTDIYLSDAAGAFELFPYPLEGVAGKLEVREGYVDIIDVKTTRGNSSVKVDGRVAWSKPARIQGPGTHPTSLPSPKAVLTPNLKITARDVPIDETFLAALPPERRQWLETVGLKGQLDIDGVVTRRDAAPGDRSTTAPASGMAYKFDVKLSDGVALPVEGTYALTDLAGHLQLTEDRLVLTSLTGKRGNSDIIGRGTISWPENRPHVAVHATLNELVLDSTLYQVLPPEGRRAWDEVQPEGVVDVELSYAGDTRLSESQSKPLLDLTIRPRKLAATVKAIPYRLEDIGGSITYKAGSIALNDVTARHGEGRIRISGTGTPASQTEERRTVWDLRIAADQVQADKAFREALPEALADLMTGLKLDGAISFDFSKLRVVLSEPSTSASGATTVASAAAPPVAPATTKNAPPAVDVDFAVKVKSADAAMNLGVDIAEFNGAVDVAGTVRAGRLMQLDATLDAESLEIAERPASNLHATLHKSSSQDTMRITDMRGELAGGELAGQVELEVPRVGPSRYALNLILRDADVRTIAVDTGDREVTGRLTASLAMEGNWSDANSRRGRGDVSVSGKEMYKIPLVLGLLQITNLSLPITSPFNEAGVDYSIDGPRVTAERISLRSKDMLMEGSGTIDFDTKRVRMSFTTDNPNWPKLPIVTDLVQGAKRELLKIKVRGTIEQPKVSASPMNTFTTTVDEVLRGDGEP